MQPFEIVVNAIESPNVRSQCATLGRIHLKTTMIVRRTLRAVAIPKNVRLRDSLRAHRSVSTYVESVGPKLVPNSKSRNKPYR